MFRWLKEILIPYDPDKQAIAPPSGPKKQDNDSEARKTTGSLYIDSEGNSYRKDEDSEANLEWSQKTGKRKKGITIPDTSTSEQKAIENEGLDLSKYEEVRPHFFLNHGPREIEAEYRKHKIDGFSKSTLYPYYNIWKSFHSPKRPKK